MENRIRKELEMQISSCEEKVDKSLQERDNAVKLYEDIKLMHQKEQDKILKAKQSS